MPMYETRIPFVGFFDQKDVPDTPTCDWSGCTKEGEHVAPRRNQEGSYHFCLIHAREYNKRWNFFDGMSEAEISAFYEDATTGHRPTYKREGHFHDAKQPLWSKRFNQLFAQMGYFRDGEDDSIDEIEQSPSNNLTREENKAFKTIEFTITSDWGAIRTQYKRLVKKYHPDQYGGDETYAEKLKQINEAYEVLKKRFG